MPISANKIAGYGAKPSTYGPIICFGIVSLLIPAIKFAINLILAMLSVFQGAN